MTAPRLERKLVAILAADAVGFSRCMELDEARTLDLLSERRRVMDDLIEDHAGRVTGTAGDSVIAEFISVVDAVDCAVEIQRRIVRLNQDDARDQALSFRIGVNVGDVMVKDADIFGDGVNVAARLESLADADGICLSRGVHDHVRKQSRYTFDDLGEQSVKNIEHPLRVFKILFEDGEPVISEENWPIEEDVSEMAAAGEPPEYELTFWESIQESADPAEFEAYLERYPKGAFAALAVARLKSLDATQPEHEGPAADPVELAFWDSVKDSDTKDLFKTYLAEYPEGAFSEIARIQITKLRS